MPTTLREPIERVSALLNRLRQPRTLIALIACGLLFAVAAFAPHPAPQQIRQWADSVGPTLPLVFFAVHTLVCVAPFPRTIFTLSAGMLFGTTEGLTLAITATTLSAVLALWLVRALDHERVRARLTHPAVQAVDARLARRGWLAIGSLRLIAIAPFSIVNYCAALSSIRLTPYLIATFLGIIPGTVGTVLLGDALTNRTSPAQLIVTAILLGVGVIGLVVDARMSVEN
ncbi:TVP38/TMEM64 family protein [Nocardia sp. CDC160]|uniref:TVP38/TMEM64 family protein n=1 Tax=Nocardia sp. CDC160 TaxID=3112166 RepID=UPI002DBEF688|nr:TVP38/TMEM64 family protein [Nocardia sp. CDC160]MEC3917755.1 TVP38/TMEM64 family protein [Nocardia sp. CDC160]